MSLPVLPPARQLRRFVAGSIAALLGAAVAVAGAPQPAAAGLPYAIRASSPMAYTDARTPNAATYVQSGEAAPVGTWRDQNHGWHVSRTYITFILDGVSAASFGTATVTLREATVADCARPLTLRMRPTEPFTPQNSWRRPPAPRTPTTSAVNRSGDCPSWDVAIDASVAVLAAVQQGRRSVTFELSLAGLTEFIPAFGRTLMASEFRLVVTPINLPPAAPTNLRMWNLDIPCTGDQHFPGVNVEAIAQISDPDGGMMRTVAELWAVDSPDVRTTLEAGPNNPAFATIHGAELADGEYVWRMRTSDSLAWGPWSAECHFTIDKVAPGAPTVTSTDYPAVPAPPSGSPWQTGVFTFSGNGDPDIASFKYGDSFFTMYDTATPDQPGGTVNVDWFPMGEGEQELYVVAVDKAGNHSPVTVYRYAVTPY